MKTKRIHLVFITGFSILVLTAFSDIQKKKMHADEGEILTFEYTNFEGGLQYIRDTDTAFFPFINNSGHDITLVNIVSKNEYSTAPYLLISPESRITYKDKQRDTIFFRRINNGSLKEGSYDHAWVISFEGIAQKQYLNIFCQLEHNHGKLVAEHIRLQTVKRGEIIAFQARIKNIGSDEVLLNPSHNWIPKSLILLDAYPVIIQPGESKTLQFELQTESLFNTYAQTIYFATNTDESDQLSIDYTGQLISENYPSILFDSTALTLNTYQGGPGDFEFWFTNDGSAPLLITMVKTSCGCLAPSYYPKEPIKPGERNVIKIHYDTNRIGPINKSITVYTNVSDYPLVLRVLGNITAKE